MEPGTTFEILPLLKAFGTMFGTYGLWRLAARLRAAKGLKRIAAWGWFSGGVGLAVGLLAVVVYEGEPSLGSVAVVSSLAMHAPWIAFLLVLVLADDHDSDRDRELPDDPDREFPC